MGLPQLVWRLPFFTPAELVIRLRYESDLSAWEFPTPEIITNNEAAVDSMWITLDELAANKQARLAEDRAREETKESLRQDFALAADSMQGFIKDTCLLVASSGGDDGPSGKSRTIHP